MGTIAFNCCKIVIVLFKIALIEGMACALSFLLYNHQGVPKPECFHLFMKWLENGCIFFSFRKREKRSLKK